MLTGEGVGLNLGALACCEVDPLLATLTEDVLQGRLIHVPIP